MANICVYRDPAGIKPPEVHLTNGEVGLAEWMLENVVDGSQDLHCQVLLNGREIVNTETMSVEQCCENTAVIVGLFDNVTIKFRPQGIELSLWVIAAIAIGAAAVTIALAPKPKIPGQVDTGTAGGNNQLNSSTNSFRPRQAIPDIAGQVVAYPDFIQPSYYIYVDNRRRFTELFCASRGYVQFGEWKTGESPLSELPGSSVEVFEPGEAVDNLLNVRTAIGSEDIDLTSPDQDGRILAVSNATLTAPDTIFGIYDVPADWEVGDTVNVELTYLSGGVTTSFSTSAALTFVEFGTFYIQLDAPVPDSDLESANGTITNLTGSGGAQWHTLDGDAIEKIWFHVKAITGIRKGDGESATVQFKLDAQELDSEGDPTGPIYSITRSFTGNSQTAIYQTFEMGLAQGITPGSYRARAYRITPTLGDNALELVQLEKIDSVTPYLVTDFGDATTVRILRSTPATGGQSNASSKINVLATRRLRIYNNETGVYGTSYVATRRFCDYAFYLLHEIARVPIARINTDELFGIQDNLTDQQLGYFDYTFDDGNVGLKEALETCCNAARVRYWNEGLLWSFVREEAKPFKSLMFNRRNLTAISSRYVQKFRRPSDQDSVTIIYVDPVKNSEKRVSRRINSSGAIVAGAGIRPLEINLTGCRNDLQALNRCELEVRRLIYQAIKVTDTALSDGQLARLGMRVDWVDQYDLDLFDGELLSVSTNQYLTSERFTPQAGVEYWVYVTDQSGQPSNSVRCYPRADGSIFGFQADGLTGAFVANGVIQAGSRYFICSDDDSAASTFTVIGRGRPNEAGECDIELAEYNELMFSED